MTRWLALLPLALSAAPALAQQDEPRPDYYGVWKGTVGTYPVMMCIERDGLGQARGAYYYLSRLTPIGLAGRDDGPPAGTAQVGVDCPKNSRSTARTAPRAATSATADHSSHRRARIYS